MLLQARAAAPCLLILDELDSIAPARSGSDDNGDEVGRRLLGTLLNEMDGIGHVNAGSSSSSSAQSDMIQLRSQDGVIFVGCSNRRDAIDPAVRSTPIFRAHTTCGCASSLDAVSGMTHLRP